ncbi:MAG: N-6 DNA methylase [Acidobacteria bacterium]|nr:N-6 DNA methylase [Acidobacteriota bacterium]
MAMRIVGRSVGALSARASLRAGEAWFLGDTLPLGSFTDTLGDLIDREAVQALESFAYDDDLRDLLPYVLDAHGPGSRASVMKDPGTQKSRQAKRSGGIFYTPSDVAEYIARETLGEPSSWPYPAPRVLDPSCGSGVFLKAVLDVTVSRTPELDRLAFVERSLHGIDVDPLAVEAACFVLLHECLATGWRRSDESPWSRWHRIRCNLCVADALTFQVAEPNDCADALARVRSRLDDGYLPPAAGQATPEGATTLFSEGRSLGNVFPALAAGADVVIGNPPYAKIGPRADAAALERRFTSLSARAVAGSDYFPAFVEMMWRLAKPGGSASGMVVPLSLACNRRSQLSTLRRAIVASGGRWRFAFFDREPHALFGEEVKTRNTIAFRQDGPSDAGSTTAEIETGPLRKWTSRQRSRLFDTIEFTPISDAGISITTGIPKLDGAESARVFGRLARLTSRLREMCSSVSSCLPADVGRGHADACVFVAGTAYNFLNVFRSHRNLPVQRAPWSASTVQSLEFSGEEQAARGFALLCSRISFWLWRVNEDGFHVSRSFLLGLPFNDRTFDKTEQDALTQLGTRLWDRVQSHQIISINGGRQTVAYRPDTGEEIRDEIDALVLDAIGVGPSFGEYLREFTRTVVTVDAPNGRQSRLRFC